MPNIPIIRIGNRDYNLSDTQLRNDYNRKVEYEIPNHEDLLANNVRIFTDDYSDTLSMTIVPNTAWRKNLNHTSGSNYQYLRVNNVPGSYAGKVIYASGHSWGTDWPLILCYDSNNNLLATACEIPDKRIRRMPFIIPKNTSYIIINGSPNDPYSTIAKFDTIASALGMFGSTLKPFGRYIDSSFLTAHPEYSDVREWPSDFIYALGDSVYSLLSNLPNSLNTYATLIKFSPSISQDGALHGYVTYLLINERVAWLGFDNNNGLYWRCVFGNVNARRYLFIGDSYGDGYSHDGSNSGWCEYLAQDLSLSSTNGYVAKHQGGNGFVNGGFKDRLESAAPGYFSDVVVLGGFNDYNQTYENIKSGISTFCARSRQLYPGANIHIGCVGWIKQGTDPSYAYANWQEVRQKIIDTVIPAYKCASEFGASYINMSEYLLNDSLLTNSDGYHPGEAGNRAIARGIANGLMTGTAVLPYNASWRQE